MVKYFLATFIWLASVGLSPAQAGIDICLEITGTKAQARAALTTLGLTKEMISRDQNGDPVITTGNHHVAVDAWMKPILDYGPPVVFAARPYLRIRFHSKAAARKAREKIGTYDENGNWVPVGALPTGLTRVPCPTTRIWLGD